MKRDLESLGEFIRRWLSQEQRWSSPIYIAGESYGGFRTAKMAKQLQQDDGVGLTGVFLISPALEFSSLYGNDYSILYWLDKFPTMAAAGYQHKMCKADKVDFFGHLQNAERFAKEKLAVLLASGESLGNKRRQKIYQEMSNFTGIKAEVFARCDGRLTMTEFARTLLREKSLALGLYDASIATHDPFIDRPQFEGPDPTLAGLGRIFGSGIHMHLHDNLGVTESIRNYNLLSYEVHKNWKYNSDGVPVSATDDLRYGMTLNPDMQVFITHGYFDLVTPYYASDRLINLMKLTKLIKYSNANSSSIKPKFIPSSKSIIV